MGLIVGPIAALTLYEWRSAVPFALNIALMAGLVIFARANPALHRAGDDQRLRHPLARSAMRYDRFDQL